MITLGIETTCDETAFCLMKDGKILSESLASSMQLHSKYGGVIPEIASRHQLEVFIPCLSQALKKANLKINDIDLIACSGGPGLMGAIIIGVSIAKSLAIALGKPVVFVDHVLAHGFSGQIGRKKTTFPFVSLIVSGGHTIVLEWTSLSNVKILGKTHDDAVGEAFDKVAKMLGLDYPGGPQIEKLAVGACQDRYNFPRPWLNEDHFNFSYSGLKTAVMYAIKELDSKKIKITPKIKKNIAFGFQEAACEVLVKKSVRACQKVKSKLLVVGGGVSANARLQLMFKKYSNEIEVVFPSKGLSTDNASMIAALGSAVARKKLKKMREKSAFVKTLKFRPYTEFPSKPSLLLRV